MKQEELILLQDLCARLPYDVKVIDDLGRIYTLTLGDSYLIDLYYGNGDYVEIPIKPYIRPMSSMTEEEKSLFLDLRNALTYQENGEYDLDDFNELQDFLNRNHLDYRGLIEMGLAIEAPEGMYNIKTE